MLSMETSCPMVAVSAKVNLALGSGHFSRGSSYCLGCLFLSFK